MCSQALWQRKHTFERIKWRIRTNMIELIIPDNRGDTTHEAATERNTNSHWIIPLLNWLDLTCNLCVYFVSCEKTESIKFVYYVG